jgi:hypothetical protein
MIAPAAAKQGILAFIYTSTAMLLRNIRPPHAALKQKIHRRPASGMRVCYELQQVAFVERVH